MRLIARTSNRYSTVYLDYLQRNLTQYTFIVKNVQRLTSYWYYNKLDTSISQPYNL